MYLPVLTLVFFPHISYHRPAAFPHSFGPDTVNIFLVEYCYLGQVPLGRGYSIARFRDKNPYVLETHSQDVLVSLQPSNRRLTTRTDVWRSHHGLPRKHYYVLYDQLHFFFPEDFGGPPSIWTSCTVGRDSMMLVEERLSYAASQSLYSVAPCISSATWTPSTNNSMMVGRLFPSSKKSRVQCPLPKKCPCATAHTSFNVVENIVGHLFLGTGVDYGFCCPVNRPCLYCRLLTFRLGGSHFLFEHPVNGCESLARVSEKARDGPSNHTDLHRLSSVVAEQRGWDLVALW